MDEIMKKLSQVNDPELFISIVDLGLIYDVSVVDKTANISMTLTTIGCPLFSVIEKEINEKVLELDNINNVHVQLVFDPPWSMDRMTERGKAILGI